MHIDGEKKFHYKVDKKIVGHDDIKALKEYLRRMAEIKRTVTKTPLLTDDDHRLLEEKYERVYLDLKLEF